MSEVKQGVFWFMTGSQHLYGEETLLEVENHSIQIQQEWNKRSIFPNEVVFKGVLTNASDIERAILEANYNDQCLGIILWMHTFSPGKMWINGLLKLQKPLLHLHTQFLRDIQWDTIDMNYMNLHQSAHGDREFGHMLSRTPIQSKVIVGHWKQIEVQENIARWMDTAAALAESRQIRVARFGDNMRNVAVTDGDRVAAQLKLGWTVENFGVGDLVSQITRVSNEDVEQLMAEYRDCYDMRPPNLGEKRFFEAIKEQAKIELALKAFLVEGCFQAFTTNFEELHGMQQLPGLAVQRLMSHGYGFAAEGDWKTAALTRLVKVMARNRNTSFMEDYTYQFAPENEMVLGAHMLEICPSITNEKPKVIVHPLSIGGKQDPARLVFSSKPGNGVVTSLVDVGSRFRLIVNKIQAVEVVHETPNLPVAKALWKPLPSLPTSAEAWIYAGGSHHTVYSLQVTVDQLSEWAELLGIECVVINEHTDVSRLKYELKLNDIIWR